MDTIADFLDDWGRRWAEAIAAAVGALPADVTAGRIYGAAVTVADGNTVPGLLVQTESRLAAITDPEADPATARYYRWWPDESGLEVTDDALAALSSELGAWAEAHPQVTTEPGEDFLLWSEGWVVNSDRALVAAMGSSSVRQAFASHELDPVLVVTETDGGASRALAAFDALNSDRDDDLAVDARLFWQENAGS
ncbi:hypothetical protein [Lentzea sp. NPDC060358]|uniref:hypothetical protein n=1 Tax=Lentzea sp. NPDC060358 TaxID=3347103 RepID=UPI003662E461